MSYIGKQPVVGNFQVCDAITVVNGQAAYTMQVSSANVTPESANHMLVSLNGVLQKPGSSFTISGATITFASNLATGDVIDFIILLGNVLDIGTPSDSTITNAKLASDVISGETDIGGAIADADLFLLDDGAGGTLRKTAASRIKTYVGGGITAAQQFRLTSGFTGDAVVSSNLTETSTAGYGALGSAVSHSSGVFTFASTGYYYVLAHWQFYTDTGSNSRYNNGYISYSANNGGAWTQGVSNCTQQLSDDGASAWHGNASNSYLFDITDTANQKVRFETAFDDNGVTCHGGTGGNETHFTFIRLGDT